MNANREGGSQFDPLTASAAAPLDARLDDGAALAEPIVPLRDPSAPSHAAAPVYSAKPGPSTHIAPGDAPGHGTHAGAPARAAAARVAAARRGEVLYPGYYVWYVFLASLDIMMTWVILHLGGLELNPLADWIIEEFGTPGVVTFKFGLVMLVVCICELVGRRQPRRGLLLARWAVVLTAFPVVVASIQIVARVLRELQH